LKQSALVSAINLIILSTSNVYAASNTDVLEKRIRELESRLEKLDHAATVKPASPEVEDLSKKVNLLARKVEVQDETNGGLFKALPKFDAGENGFRITSSDKKHSVRIRGAVQADSTFFQDDHQSLTTDSFTLKQGRVWIEGYLWKDLYYKIMPDFAATNILPDAYLDYAYVKEASLTVGKFKSPLSLERLQGDSDGTFLERAYPTYLASNRDVGVMIHGGVGKSGFSTEYTGTGNHDTKNLFSYQLGVFNGSGDDGSPDKSSPDTNDDKEFVGRVWAHPFQHTGSVLDGLGLGVAGSWENPSKQLLANQRTPIARATYLDYSKLASGVDVAPTANGEHYRIYPQAYWYTGPFGLMAEYVTDTQTLSSTKAGKALNVKQDNTSWQVLASYVLTGEDNTFQGVKPMQKFDPFAGKWGALQVAGRWTELSVDKSTFLLIDSNKSANHATTWTLGLNWYLNANALIRADYEHTNFNGGAAGNADRQTEKVFATRFQLSF
ncbi:MAG: porin, partial [Methylococcales bacterium]|nr:porin [Methylococcales bacterium]